MMILLFICLLIYFGVWLTLKISSNYNVFLSCRQLYNILLWGVYIMACIGFSLCLVNYQNVTRNTFSVEKVGMVDSSLLHTLLFLFQYTYSKASNRRNSMILPILKI